MKTLHVFKITHRHTQLKKVEKEKRFIDTYDIRRWSKK